MPIETSLELIKKRENKFSHTEVKDIHESSEKHLEESYKSACSLVSKYGWYEINCVKNGKLRTIDDIHEEIYKEVIGKIK